MPSEAIGHTARRSTPPRVLIVDDNDLMLEIAEAILRVAGFSTYATADPATGIGAAMTQPFDVVLLDINMPVISGIEVIGRIREADGPNHNTPIIAFTAAPESRHSALLKVHRFDAIVTKPIVAANLLNTIRRVLE